METEEMVVTYKVGGVHVKTSNGKIDFKTTNFVAVLTAIALAQLPVRVVYSSEPIVSESDPKIIVAVP